MYLTRDESREWSIFDFSDIDIFPTIFLSFYSYLFTKLTHGIPKEENLQSYYFPFT